MIQKVRAVYQSGKFVLQEPYHFPEGTVVELIVRYPEVIPPEVTDPAEKADVLKGITERMRQSPLPSATPHLTREALHARR